MQTCAGRGQHKHSHCSNCGLPLKVDHGHKQHFLFNTYVGASCVTLQAVCCSHTCCELYDCLQLLCLVFRGSQAYVVFLAVAPACLGCQGCPF